MTEMKELHDAIAPRQGWARIGMRVGLIGGLSSAPVAVVMTVIVSRAVGAPGRLVAVLGVGAAPPLSRGPTPRLAPRPRSRIPPTSAGSRESPARGAGSLLSGNPLPF